jgi:hypothetical protein
MKDHNGIYIPPGLHRKSILRFSIDNVDSYVDTPDGRNSFHATAMAVYQQEPLLDEGPCDITANPLRLTSIVTSRALSDVPSTVVPLLQSNITESPRPETSPHYPDFKLGNNEDELIASELNDIVWLLARYSHRDACDQTRGPDVAQPVPVWSAYNSILCSQTTEGHKPIDKVHALPLINTPAHEWSTLITALVQLYRLNANPNIQNGRQPALVWLDMDLYKRVRKIPFLDPQFSGRIIESPGPFHTVLCALRCLGVTLESSGLDQAWVEADLYSNVTEIGRAHV